ncbi:MAG: O-antigen ligase family protein [Bacteroidetes bacterium]|nr:O-antigen ligase family protein [Bacteroidota bacterium]
MALFLLFAYLLLLRVKTAYAAVALCLIAALIIFILQFRKRNNNIGLSYRRLIVLALLILSATFAQTTVPFIQPSDRDSLSKSLKAMFNLNNSTNGARIEFWNASLRMFSEHPITGIGAGMWPGVYPEFNGTVYTDENVDMNSAINPHNDYLRFISEFGISGIFYFLFISGSVLILFNKSLTEKNNLPFLFTSTCYFVTSIFNFTYDNVFAMMLFLFSLSTAYADSNSLSRTLRREKWPLSVLIIVALILMSLRLSYQKDYENAIRMKFQGDYYGAAKKLESINDVIYPVDPNKIPVSYYLGTSYFELKNYRLASFCFERASTLMPFYPSVMGNTAATLYKDGNVGESINMFKKMCELYPNFFEPQINLLSVYANEKMNAEAKILINDLNRRIIEHQFIKNYIVFLEIKNYYQKNGL